MLFPSSTFASMSLFTLRAIAASSVDPDMQVTTSSDGQCYNGNGVGIVCPGPSTTTPTSAGASAPAATSDGDAVRAENVQKAVCHFYQTNDMSMNQNALQEDCAGYCGNMVKPDNVEFRSVTCDASTPAGAVVPTYTTDKGVKYTFGVCRCDMAEMDFFAHEFIDIVEVMAEITCQVFFTALDTVLTVASLAIPGVGEMGAASAGLQTAIKFATQIADKGGMASDFVQGFLDPCGSGTNYTTNPEALFMPLIGKGKPGQGLKPKPKTNDPDAPKTNDPLTKATSADAKPTSANSKVSSATSQTSNAATSDTKQTSATSQNSKTATSSNSATTGATTGNTAAQTSGATSGGTSNPSTTKPTSTSSSSSTSSGACSATASSRAARKARRDGEPYAQKIPTDCEANDIVDMLKQYKPGVDTPTKTKLINLITSKYMSQKNPPKDTCIFYAGDAASAAAYQVDIAGMTNIAEAFYGYGVFPFDEKLQPFKAIAAQKTNLEKAWFQATSLAFAKQCAGEVVFVYDGGDWKTAMGRDGKPSIFVTDEMPALMANSAVTHIYQVTSNQAFSALLAGPVQKNFQQYVQQNPTATNFFQIYPTPTTATTSSIRAKLTEGPTSTATAAAKIKGRSVGVMVNA